ncbi:hypothetical protein [Paenibacillus sp. TSA_86.1]|uniref:hypothetical protein n=1 Tax=Paenibacillus sp. TSA_86.1 TaxID=3415649 RepID=UPI00404530CF
MLLFTLLATVTLAGGTAAQAAPLSQSTVYYESDGVLYKVAGDGSNSAGVLIDFEGIDLTAAGSYLYYTQSASSTALLRIPNDGSSDAAETFASDVINYYADKYRANGDQGISSVTKIADKVNKTSNLNLSNVTYVTNQWMKDKPEVAYISGKNGPYAVNSSLKVSKIAGDEWDTFHLRLINHVRMRWLYSLGAGCHLFLCLHLTYTFGILLIVFSNLPKLIFKNVFHLRMIIVIIKKIRQKDGPYE